MKTIGQSPISIKQETNPCGGFKMTKIGKNFKQSKILYHENRLPNGGIVGDFTKAWSDKHTLVLDKWGGKSEEILTHGYYDKSRSKNTFKFAVGGSIDQPKKIRTSFILHHSGSWNPENGDRVEVYRNGDLMIKYYWDGYKPSLWGKGVGPMTTCCPKPKTRGGIFNNCSYTMHMGLYSSPELLLEYGSIQNAQQGYLIITSDWLDVTSEYIEYEFNMILNQIVSNEAGHISHMKVEELIPENYDIDIESAPNTQIMMAEDKQSYYYESTHDSAAVYRSNWSDQNIHTVTTDTLGTFTMHDLSATSSTLTVDNLPAHEEVRFSVYCHFVDTWDAGEGCIISCSDRDNVLQERARWLKNWSYPTGGAWEIEDYAEYVDRYGDLRDGLYNTGDDKKQIGLNHWVLFGSREDPRTMKVAHVEFVPDNYGSNQQNRLDTNNGYVKFVSAWMPHDHDSFQGKIHMTSDQARIDEAGYVSHAHVEVRGGNRTIGLTRPVANDQLGGVLIGTSEGRSRTPEIQPAGKIVVDCFWPKWYTTNIKNEYFTDTSTYPDGIWSENVPGAFGFLSNGVEYCSSARLEKTKKVLWFNDQSLNGTKYGTNGVFSRERFEKILSTTIGYTVEEPPTGDSSSNNAHYKWVIAQNKTKAEWLSFFNQYDCILWWGCNGHPTSGSIQWLNKSTDNVTNFELAFVDYINNGGGMFVSTDSGRGATAPFTDTLNILLEYFGIEIYGSINRLFSGWDINKYKIKTYLTNSEYIPTGFHPLFKNLHPEQTIPGGESDGEIRFIHKDKITSVYTTDSSGKLTITQHTGTTYGGDDKTSTKLIETGNLLIRTPNDCGGN